MDFNTVTEIKNNILQGKFLEAKKDILTLSQSAFEDMILDMSYHEESITAYSFLCFLMVEKETAELHSLAAKVLINDFFYIEGSYATALYHARRRLEFSPEDIDFLQALIFFNDIPEKLVSDEEVEEINARVRDLEKNKE